MKMKKIGIFYGSNTGNTAAVASMLAGELGIDPTDVHDVSKTAPSVVDNYDLLLLGSSTWGNGDMQDDWLYFIAALSAMDLSGKEVALFGEGDVAMSDTFCNAVGELYDRLQSTGARFIGSFNVDGLEFDHSDAVKTPGQAVGLLLDDVNHAELTAPRVRAWAATILTDI